MGKQPQQTANKIFEENPIIKIFDKPSNMRVMVTLIDAGGQPLPVSDIANQANINQQSFYNNEELLLEYGLIEKTGKVGNATCYKANLETPPVQALMDLYDTMIDAQT